MEIVIQVVDTLSDDPLVRARDFEAGCVISAHEDDTRKYTDLELTDYRFRILKFPNVPVSYGQSFIGPEIPHFGCKEPTLLERLFKLDIKNPSVPLVIENYIDDVSRKEVFFIVDPNIWPIENVISLKIKRQSLTVEIGNPSNEIG